MGKKQKKKRKKNQKTNEWHFSFTIMSITAEQANRLYMQLYDGVTKIDNAIIAGGYWESTDE